MPIDFSIFVNNQHATYHELPRWENI